MVTPERWQPYGEGVDRPNIVLRPIGEDDVRAVYALIYANLKFFNQWLDWAGPEHTLEDSLVITQTAVKTYIRRDGLMAGIWLEEPDAAPVLVGMVGLSHVERQHNAARVYFYLDQAQQGRGIATRSVRSVMLHAFSAQNFHRIAMHVSTENERAVRVAERLGLAVEGQLREAALIQDRYVDVYVFSALRSDFVPRMGPPTTRFDPEYYE